MGSEGLRGETRVEKSVKGAFGAETKKTTGTVGLQLPSHFVEKRNYPFSRSVCAVAHVLYTFSNLNFPEILHVRNYSDRSTILEGANGGSEKFGNLIKASP